MENFHFVFLVHDVVICVCCSDDDSNSNLPAKKCGGAITQPSYQLNTFHHAMNVYYDSLSLSISFSPQLKTCHQAEKTHKNKST